MGSSNVNYQRDPTKIAVQDAQQQGILNLMQNPGTVPTKQIVGETPQEKQIREQMVQGYLGQAGMGQGPGQQTLSPLETQASNYISNLLGSQYASPMNNPFTSQMSDYVQRQAKLGALSGQDSINQMFASYGQRPGFSSPWASTTQKAMTDVGTNVGDIINRQLYDQYNRNIQNQMTSLPYAMQLGDTYRTAPLRALQMAQQAYQFAGMPRSFQQQQADAQYQQLLGQLQQNYMPYNLAQQYLGGDYGSFVKQPSMWETTGVPLIAAGLGGAGSLFGGIYQGAGVKPKKLS